MLKSKAITPDGMLLRFFTKSKSPLTTEAAEYILSLKISDVDAKHLKRLAQRSRDGLLTDEEHRQIEEFSQIGSLIGILQAQARRALGKPASTKPKSRARS